MMSPASRRLTRKTSATDASAPAPWSAASPCVSGTKRGSGDMIDTSPVANGASPCPRRLRRKTSVEEGAVPCSPVALMSSPGSRRLRRKTSAEDAAPVASGPLSGNRVAETPAQPVQGRGVGMLRRGRGRGRQAGSEDHAHDAGVRRQGDAAAWFLAAADVDGSAGVARGSSGADQNGPAVARRRGVVSGFGAERTEDALGDRERRDRDAMTRARVRREDGVRGQARDFQGNDLDRSAGGAWSLGRR